MRSNFIEQFIRFLKRWLCGMRSGIVMQNWAFSVDQCLPHVLQFSVHLSDLRGILCRCSGFAGIQKAVTDLTSSRPPNSDRDLFFPFWCNFGFGKCFGAASQANH